MSSPVMLFETEDRLLSEMSGWPPLPSEDDPAWDETGWAWPAAERLVTAAGLTGEREWRRAAIRVFEHVADWDAHGMMQSIRHGPERAFGCDPRAFAAGLHPLLTHARAATRIAAAVELGVLREAISLQPLLQAIADDPDPRVVSQAEASLWTMAQDVAAAVDVLRQRVSTRRATVAVSIRLVDPPTGRRPATPVGYVSASRHSDWTVNDRDERTRWGGPKYADASMLLEHTLRLNPGDTGSAQLYPADSSQWSHLKPGDRITLNGSVEPLAYGTVASIAPPKISATDT